jgi:predicted nucleic acid-binding protein
MYLIGQDHPHKRDVILTLEKFVAEKRTLVSNVEVLQEILHRYKAIHRENAIQHAFDAVYEIADRIFDISEEDVLEAKNLVLAYNNLSARDALHAAQMKRLNIKNIFSFDSGFDQLPWIERIFTSY